MGAPDRSVWDWSLGFAVLKDSFLAHGLAPVGILTSWFPLAACRRPGEQITVCNGRVRAKRIRGISVSHQSPTVIGGLRGAEPPMRTRKPNSEKLMLLRLEISLCKVCRVNSIFLHTFINRIFLKKCEKRVYVPCTPCTSSTRAYHQMQNKMLSTLHALHNGGARRPRPEAGLRRQTGSCIVQNADFNTLYFTDSGFWGQVCSFMSILDFVIFSLRFSL